MHLAWEVSYGADMIIRHSLPETLKSEDIFPMFLSTGSWGSRKSLPTEAAKGCLASSSWTWMFQMSKWAVETRLSVLATHEKKREEVEKLLSHKRTGFRASSDLRGFPLLFTRLSLKQQCSRVKLHGKFLGENIALYLNPSSCLPLTGGYFLSYHCW